MDLEKHGGEAKVERVKARLSSLAKWLSFLSLKFFQIPVKDQLND